jgi:hypothetical protein
MLCRRGLPLAGPDIGALRGRWGGGLLGVCLKAQDLWKKNNVGTFIFFHSHCGDIVSKGPAGMRSNNSVFLFLKKHENLNMFVSGFNFPNGRARPS